MRQKRAQKCAFSFVALLARGAEPLSPAREQNARSISPCAISLDLINLGASDTRAWLRGPWKDFPCILQAAGRRLFASWANICTIALPYGAMANRDTYSYPAVAKNLSILIIEHCPQ